VPSAPYGTINHQTNHMFDIERWQEIFDTIRKNKLRTFLTGLSVASGIFILVILLGFGQGMQNGIAKEFESDASTRFGFWTNSTSKAYKGLNAGRSIQMRNNNFEYLENKYADVLDSKSGVFRVRNALIVYKKETGSYRVEGVTPSFQMLENQYMISGRFLNFADLEGKLKVAVISNKIKNELFKNNENPLEEHVIIAGINFKVIGVYGDPSERDENRIVIPITTAQAVFNGADRVNNMYFTMKPVENFDEAVAQSMAVTAQMKSYLQETHTVAPDDESAIGSFNTLENAKRFFTLIDNIKLFFWIVGVFTIIAGVVGVSNIMLIVVKERTREIGIRKALGAKPWSIVGMILQEAIFVTTIAGFSGLIFSMGLLEFVGPYIEVDYLLNPSVNFNVALTTVFVLIFAGVFAGFFPAWKAANIHTIDALRHE